MTKTLTLQTNIVRTPLDEIGSLLNVDRIPNEELKDYADRLYSAYVKRSSSTYQGLLNGINRALGLNERPLIEVRYRAILSGDVTDNINLTSNSIEDTSSYSGTVNGGTITAVGNKLTDTTQAWIPHRLKGMTLTINSVKYEILDNTATVATISGSMSGLLGFGYTIALELETDKLVGLAVRMGNQIYKIIQNTTNKLYLNTTTLTSNPAQTYTVTAYNPKVEVTASNIYLFKEFANTNNFQLEKSIDLRKDFKFHKDIVSEINTCYYFEATDLTEYKDKALSISFKKQSSEHIVSREIVPANKYFRLSHPSIKEGSVEFAESSVFLREVDENDVGQIKGNYYVEYNSGAVLTGSIPSGNKTVSYVWNEFPFNLYQSPTIVNAFSDEDIKNFLFSLVEMRYYENETERFIPGQPTADMIEYIAELLKVRPQNWGI